MHYYRNVLFLYEVIIFHETRPHTITATVPSLFSVCDNVFGLNNAYLPQSGYRLYILTHLIGRG